MKTMQHHTTGKRPAFSFGLCILMLTLLLSACHIDLSIDEDYNNRRANEALCEYTWEEHWVDDHGYHHYSQLIFHYDGCGKEFYWVENRRGQIVDRYESDMQWAWTNHSYTSIQMNFWDGTSYLDGIEWRGPWMYCRRDNVMTEFRRID